MNEKYKKIFDKLYYALLIITIINMCLPTTNFEYDKYKFALNAVQFILQISMVFKVCLEWKNKWTNKDILIGILTAGIFFAVGCNFGRQDAFVYAFLIMGAKDIDKKKILNVIFFASLAMFVFTVGACLLGFIENTTTYRTVDSTHARMSLGFIYTTSLSAHYLLLVVAYVMIRDRKISIPEILFIAVSAGVTYYLTEARIASFAIAMIAVGLVVAKICYMKNIEFKLVRFAFIKWGMIFASCIMMAFAVITGVLFKFDNDFWSKVDRIFSGRISNDAITFNRYPLSMLGKDALIHCKIYDGMNELPEYYYIINCSYIEILFRIGILGAVAVLLIWTLLSYKEVKSNNYMNAFMLAVLTVFFFFEQRFFEFTFNPFLILILSKYSINTIEEKYNINVLKKLSNGNKIFRTILTAVVLAFLVDVAIFNYKSWTTFLNEGADTVEGDWFTDEIARNDKLDMSEYTVLDPRLVIYNVKTYNDLESIKINMNFMTMEDNRHYKLVDGVKYSVDYYTFIGNGEYSYIGTAEIDSSKPWTQYMPASVFGPYQNIYYEFHFPDYYYIDISKWEYNSAKPFHINFIRMLIVAAALAVGMTVATIVNGKKSIAKKENEDESSNADVKA